MNAEKKRKSLLPVAVLAIASIGLFVPWTKLFRPNAAPPARRESRLETARKLSARNNHDALVRLGAGVSPGEPDAAEIHALVGRSFLAQGQVGHARKALEMSLNQKLAQPDALELLAAIYLASGDATRGLALLELVSKYDPDAFRPWLAIGKVRHDQGETGEAATAYRKCLERNPPPQEARAARLGLLRALTEASEFEQASEIADDYARKDSDEPEILGLAAIVTQSTDRIEDAKRYAEAALKLDADQPDALLALARIRFLEGDAASAESLLIRADRKKPNQTAVLQLMMQAQAAQGNTEAANRTKSLFQAVTARIARMDKLSKAISAQPDDPRPRYELGLAALEGGMRVLAEQCFRAALDLDPNFAEARDRLAEMSMPE